MYTYPLVDLPATTVSCNDQATLLTKPIPVNQQPSPSVALLGKHNGYFQFSLQLCLQKITALALEALLRILDKKNRSLFFCFFLRGWGGVVMGVVEGYKKGKLYANV